MWRIYLNSQPDISKVENIRSRIQSVENTLVNAEALAFYFRQVYFDGNQKHQPITNLPKILSDDLGFIVKVNELGKKQMEHLLQSIILFF